MNPCKVRAGAAAAVASLVLIGCTDATGPLRTDEGVVRFDYSGAESGSWEARGVRPEDWTLRTHAAGLRYGSTTTVRAHRRKIGGLTDGMWLAINSSQPGSYEVAGLHTGPVSGGVAFDVDESRNVARAVYDFVEGSVTLEPNLDGRIRGHFTVTAFRALGTETISISGSFDVPNNLEPPQELAARASAP